MATETAAPVLLELDEATWDAHLARAASWLGQTITAQEKFRKYAEDTAARIREPHIKKYLEEIAARARGHEDLAKDLSRALRGDGTAARSLAGTVMAKGGELIAGAVGLAGGARGNWTDLRQLLIESQDAIGAFAIVEQLGYALGLTGLAEPAFRALAEKWKDHLLIQEYVLEMAPVAILMHADA